MELRCDFVKWTFSCHTVSKWYHHLLLVPYRTWEGKWLTDLHANRATLESNFSVVTFLVKCFISSNNLNSERLKRKEQNYNENWKLFIAFGCKRARAWDIWHDDGKIGWCWVHSKVDKSGPSILHYVHISGTFILLGNINWKINQMKLQKPGVTESYRNFRILPLHLARLCYMKLCIHHLKILSKEEL